MKHKVKVQFNDKFVESSVLNQQIYKNIESATGGTCEIEFDDHYPRKFRVLNSGTVYDMTHQVSILFSPEELHSFEKVITCTLNNAALLAFVCKHYKVTLDDLNTMALKRKAIEDEIAKLEKELNDFSM